MSEHHRRQRWSTASPKLRAKIEPLLPLPCIECGRPVLPGSKWHVGHRRAASAGGQATAANVGPAHVECNLRAGGKLGARVTNAQRRQANGLREW